MTLITGKKFDPAPLESAIATSPHLDDVLIFGNGRPYPGALLLRSEESSSVTDQELLEAIQPVVEKLNRESQDHARIPMHMLITISHQTQPLEKSSKGTIIRKAADARFENFINRAYDGYESTGSTEVADGDLTKHFTRLVQDMTSQSGELSEDIDLFSYGVDSIACMQLRNHIRQLVPNGQEPLPMSIIEDCGSIRRLTEYVLRKRHGEADVNEDDENELMLDLVRQYGSFDTASTSAAQNRSNKPGGEVIVLTGATGALGAHILDLLLKSEKVDTVYCLVRGLDEHAAASRVSKALQQRGLTANLANPKVKITQAQLSDAHLGLPDDLYSHLAKSATSIIHVAWAVNFRLKLRSFVHDNIAGLHNLLNLALHSPRAHPPRFTYCSSTASIINSAPDSSGQLPESIQPDPASASPLGYSRSKWVAEHICLAAHRRTTLRGRVAVVRVGQLTGDSATGIWNAKEAWPMMLSTARLIRCLPDLGTEPLDWLPVDVAARAFVEVADEQDDDDDDNNNEGGGGDMHVYHVLNPQQEPTWRQMVRWCQKKEDFEIVSPGQWVERLEGCEGSEHSAMKLLGLWKEAYGEGREGGNGDEGEMQRKQFSMKETKANIKALKDVQPLDEKYVEKMWDWIMANVH